MNRLVRIAIISALLVCALALIAACAAPPPPPSSDAGAATEAAADVAVEAGADTGAATEAAAAAPAEASTELNLLCTPQVQWCEGMKAEFEKVYPDITVNFVRLSAGEALARLRSEKDNPQFDIWWGGPIDSFVAAANDGLLEPYDSPNLANLRDPKCACFTVTITGPEA